MTRARPSFEFEPRLMTASDVAHYLRRSASWLADHLAQLQAAGFPRADGLTGLFDRRLVDLWLDRRSGLAARSDAVGADRAELDEEFSPRGERERAVPRNP